MKLLLSKTRIYETFSFTKKVDNFCIRDECAFDQVEKKNCYVISDLCVRA